MVMDAGRVRPRRQQFQRRLLGASRSTLVDTRWNACNTGWPGFSVAASWAASTRFFGRRTTSSVRRPSGDGLSAEP